MPHIETSDKSILKHYHSKPTQKESTPENVYCPFCGKRKRQAGRFWICLSCRNPQLPSGKALGKFSKDYLIKKAKRKYLTK